MTFKFGITDFSGEVKERVTGSNITHGTPDRLSVRQKNDTTYIVTGGVFQTRLTVTDAKQGTVDCWTVENAFTVLNETECTAIAKCDDGKKADLTFLFNYKLIKDGKWFLYAELSFVKVLD